MSDQSKTCSIHLLMLMGHRHHTFFTKQHPLVPVIHPGRYMQAFYSGPLKRPPMALSYAIWTMAANGHEKYSAYHDAFHRRCRHYLQEDELRVWLSLHLSSRYDGLLTGLPHRGMENILLLSPMLKLGP